MKPKHTLFFLGAGSSVSFGLPCSEPLIREICDDLKKESPLKIYLRDEIKIAEDKLEIFGHSFIEAVCTSVDEFLEARSELKNIGKYVIGAKLISYENIDVLNSNMDNWFRLFLNETLQNCRNYNNVSDKLKLFNFYTLNYDRTIEQIIFLLFRSKYFNPDAGFPNIDFLLNSAAGRVVHAHGMLGSLSLNTDKRSRPYNNSLLDAETFKNICNHLSFWDDVKNLNPFDPILNAYIKNAERIIFLGFGFHPGILKRFDPNILKGKEIFCTFKGINQRKWDEMIQFLAPDAANYDIPFGTKKVGNVYFEETCEELIKRIIEK